MKTFLYLCFDFDLNVGQPSFDLLNEGHIKQVMFKSEENGKESFGQSWQMTTEQ